MITLDLQKTIESLTDLQQKILFTVSTQFFIEFNVLEANFRNGFEEWDLPTMTQKSYREALTELIRLNLIKKNESNVFIPADILLQVTLYFKQNNKALYYKILSKDFWSQGGWHYLRHEKIHSKIFIDLQIGKDLNLDIKETLSSDFSLPLDFVIESILVNPETISLFSTNSQKYIIATFVNFLIQFYRFPLKINLIELEDKVIETGSEEVLLSIYIYKLLKGETAVIPSGINDSLIQNSLQTIQYFLYEPQKSHKASFELLIKEWKKRHSTTKLPNSPVSVFYLLSLLFSENELDKDTLATIVSKYKVQESTPSYLKNFIHYYTGTKLKISLKLISNSSINTSLANMVSLLVAIKLNKLEYDEKEFDTLFQYAHTNKLSWLLVEAFQVKSYYKPMLENSSIEIKKVKKQLNLNNLLTELSQPAPEWKSLLDALSRSNISQGTSKKAGTEKSSRIIYEINFDQEHIQPIEQKSNKTGWTTGKNIAIKRFKELQVENMTEQDMKVASCVEEEYAGYWGGGTSFVINFNSAIKQLINHSYLYLAGANQINIQLLEGKITIQTSTDKAGNYIFNVLPNLKGKDFSKYYIEKESPTKYRYYTISVSQQNTLEILTNNTLKIPREAKDSLVSVLGNLLNHFEVESDLVAHIANSNLEIVDVKSNATIVAHLLAMGENFQIEFFIKPIHDIDNYFSPGDGNANLMIKKDQLQYRTQRNIKLEKKNYLEVLTTLTALENNDVNTTSFLISDMEQCLDIMTEMQPLVSENKIKVEWPKGEKFKLVNVIGFKDIKLKIKKSKTDWFDVDGDIQMTDSEVFALKNFLTLYKNNKSSRFIELSEGSFVALTQDLKKQLDKVTSYFSTNKEQVQIHPLTGEIMDDFLSEIGNVSLDKKWKENIEKIKEVKNKTYQIPDGFMAELRSYQNEGFQWLSRLADWGVGACLADDMGLGKTVQSIALLLARKQKGPALVVAPASVASNWVNEIATFAPSLQTIIYAEGDRQYTLDNLTENQVLILTYGLFQRDGEKLANVHFGTIILDEAQAIKNTDAKRTEVAFKLSADFKMILTGTPIENHLSEFWSLFNFINPSLLGTLKHFNDSYIAAIEAEKNGFVAQQLRKLISPFVLRRLKKDVLADLPPKTEIKINVSFSAEEKAFYESLRREAVEKLQNSDAGAGAQHLQILAEITKLRRACCHTSLVDENIDLPSSKHQAFTEIVEELIDNGHRALVFSQFTSHLALIRTLLDEKDIRYQYLDGSVPSSKRQAIVDKFQNGQDPIFLISLKAGGSGLNLTEANYVIHLDPWWNPAVEDQATDRAHRIGQEKSVTVYRLIVEQTIEDKIINLHSQKRELAESLLEGGDMSGKLSAQDLFNLINNQ